ncbi:beta-phosphoglucomutase [Leptobacterium flavescens]|uniref:Beta-phosphoglucomutase n=1 Tax=Leptobacterium flavescens TaxID=472055 RepID=A0A6P0UQ62_9FLAO|nr:beta-phosphoglucomutase [Leptobacterium flavescens]NER14652.1 beta-phosphoglucomutase [Leptobacterium flavescens]
MKKRGFIFDMDGVIVDTAHFHFLAWKKTAEELGFQLTEARNEKLKGVSRVDSLNKILKWAEASISSEEFDRLLQEKNEDYLAYVNTMTEKDILPGVYNFISELRQQNYPVALGSASKNAPTILKKVGLLDMFDTIVDGNSVSKAKPDPEVFLIAAQNLKIAPENCIVFEDSEAGVEAANTAGMLSVGLGKEEILGHADHVFSSFEEIDINFIEQLETI